MPERIIDVDATWAFGCRSDADPATLPPGYCWEMMNLVNRGGVLQVRPGYRCLTSLPAGNLQGGTIYRPKLGLEQAVIVIEGIVYVADWPFLSFRMLDNVRLLPSAKQVFFCQAEQSVERVDKTLGSALRFRETPRNVLFIQDGGFSAPVWYDGSHSGHVRVNGDEGDPYGTPTGGPMAWVGDRLWVASGAYVYASDIADPFSFREQVYLGGTGALVLPAEVTAMAAQQSIELPQLLIFTEQTTTVVQAAIRSRDQWATTPNFQHDMFKIGCPSQRSIVSQFGQLWWWSASGLTSLDAAAASKQSSRLPLRDLEMTVSKTNISGEQSLVAGGCFGNYLLMSVPSGDVFNAHTWVLDNAAATESALAWNGYWTGTRPVQWLYGTIAGQERIFHLSKDADGANRLWEAFTPERTDNGCPITWYFATRGYFGPSAPVQYPPFQDKRLAHFDLLLSEISGDVDVAAFWAGTSRGAYKRCLTRRLRAAKGVLPWDRELTEATRVFGLKPQSRRVRSEDVRQSDESPTTSCAVESRRLESIDESFQLLVVGQGEAAIRAIRVFADPQAENKSGECGEDEMEQNAVRFDGAGAEGETLVEALAPLDANEPEHFESSKTVTLTHGSLSATASGYATSVISQAAADAAAERIATARADAELTALRPPLLSDGRSYDPATL